MSNGTLTTLNDIWGSSSSDVFAVGYFGTIFHYDGIAWSEIKPGIASDFWDFWGVWVNSPTDAFAVGTEYFKDTPYLTIWHYNGSIWSTLYSDIHVGLNGVWGSSGDNVFAVGGYLDDQSKGIIMHYDGNSFTYIFPNTESLYAIWGCSSNDVFAVGENGTILHYDGSIWSTMNSGTMEDLNDVWGSSGNNVFAVGENGTILQYDGR